MTKPFDISWIKTDADLDRFLAQAPDASDAYMKAMEQTPEVAAMMENFLATEAVHLAEYNRLRSTLPDTRQGVAQLKQIADLRDLYETQNWNDERDF